MTKKNVESRKAEKECPHCMADLTQNSSVCREYINKDNSEDEESAGDDVMAYGHYTSEGFEPDSVGDLSGGRYDLRDDSDLCATCDGQLIMRRNSY